MSSSCSDFLRFALNQVSCFEVLLQNSLIIHEEKTKEVTTVSVVLYSM